MSRENLKLLSKRIHILNHVLNEIIESNKFIQDGFLYFNENKHFIVDDFEANNFYLNVLKEHLITHCQFTLINLNKIVDKNENSSLNKIYNDLISFRKKPIFINNDHYNEFINKYPLFKEKFNKLILEINNTRNNFYAHSDIIDLKNINYYLDFYFENKSIINELIEDITNLFILSTQALFFEFKGENLVNIKNNILTGKDEKGKYIFTNHETNLNKILDLFHDVSSIQDIILKNSISDIEKVNLIDEILIKDKFTYNGRLNKTYKYL
ncbi:MULTISPECIES: hypothetical protein [unclassified Empedobacter]|uniref:hypothetical protein n=1 Tax=unclassified Empedobacter TaxID=2643773 RepID=UPI0025B8AD81|nr:MULTISPECIES: hypothetical protein [unclassified Empedobacter]